MTWHEDRGARKDECVHLMHLGCELSVLQARLSLARDYLSLWLELLLLILEIFRSWISRLTFELELLDFKLTHIVVLSWKLVRTRWGLGLSSPWFMSGLRHQIHQDPFTLEHLLTGSGWFRSSMSSHSNRSGGEGRIGVAGVEDGGSGANGPDR